MIARVCSAFLVALVLSSPGMNLHAAQSSDVDRTPAWIDPGWRRAVARYVVTFDESGLSTEVFEFEIKALDEKGDGLSAINRRQRIPPRPISMRFATGSSPPHVAPGDSIRGRLVYKAKQPRFPGEFARFWSEPANQPPELLEVTLDGPASRPLRVALRNVEHHEERVNDRIVHRVRFRQDAPRPRQIDDDTFADAKRFEVSTFADYSAFAAMLDARNAPMARPDDRLTRLSREIAGDAIGTRAKVERIYNWVAQEHPLRRNWT